MADTASLLAERSADDPERLVAAGEDEEGGDPDGGYLEMSIEEAEPPRKKAKWQTTTATIVSNSASGCPGHGAGAGRGKAKGGGEGGREGAASVGAEKREREKRKSADACAAEGALVCSRGVGERWQRRRREFDEEKGGREGGGASARSGVAGETLRPECVRATGWGKDATAPQ